MRVSAVIVTRGGVDWGDIFRSLPQAWERVVWDNGEKVASTYQWNDGGWDVRRHQVQDLAVYGRYAAIEYASGDLIYVQDDDVIVRDPQAIVDAWLADAGEMRERHAFPEFGEDGISHHVVCNMPPEFRHDFYTDHALVGFGAAFHREAPMRAFTRWYDACPTSGPAVEGRLWHEGAYDEPEWSYCPHCHGDEFYRTCDVVFTALTPRILVDVPKTNLPWAEDDNRMYRQPEHVAERTRMLELALKVRDA